MKNSIRKDWKLIESLIQEKSKVLDIGCGEGELIKQLDKNLNADTRGIEIDPELPKLEVPVEIEMNPLTPVTPAFSVCIVIEPLLVSVP